MAQPLEGRVALVTGGSRGIGAATALVLAGEALATTLAKELKGAGVRVNAVAPGLTATDMGERLARATAGIADIHELNAHMPFGRVCEPQDVAEVIAFLCSPRNAYVSGQVIYVDSAHDGLPCPPR